MSFWSLKIKQLSLKIHQRCPSTLLNINQKLEWKMLWCMVWVYSSGTYVSEEVVGLGGGVKTVKGETYWEIVKSVECCLRKLELTQIYVLFSFRRTFWRRSLYATLSLASHLNMWSLLHTHTPPMWCHTLWYWAAKGAPTRGQCSLNSKSLKLNCIHLYLCKNSSIRWFVTAMEKRLIQRLSDLEERSFEIK